MAKDPSKTEKATPKRLGKARGEGQVAKSQELTKLITIFAGIMAMVFYFDSIADEMQKIFIWFLSSFGSFDATPEAIYALMVECSASIAYMVLPLMFTIAICAVIILRIQVGKLWTTKVFKPKLSKFNPITGIKRLFFSAQTFIRLGKSLLQALIIGVAPYFILRREMDNFIMLYYSDARSLAIYLLATAYDMIKYTFVPMICLAIFDLWHSRYEYHENMKMTKDEIKDEHKQQEGDPKIKAEIRQKMMKMSARRMLQDVPQADVVITNPDHYAVALHYDTKKAPAPIVLAKGVDNLALKIKEVAREHNVPIKENKALARSLYDLVEVGDMIPEDLYKAVAAILANIWKTRPGKR